MGFTKSKPRIIIYRDYKKFKNYAFRSEIKSLCLTEADLGFFIDSIFHIFNKHVHINKNCLCANEAPLMTKKLRVAIMKRSGLRNKFLREKNQANRDNYTIQRKLCKNTFAKNQKLIF